MQVTEKNYFIICIKQSYFCSVATKQYFILSSEFTSKNTDVWDGSITQTNKMQSTFKKGNFLRI